MITAVTPHHTYNDNCEEALSFCVQASKAATRKFARHPETGFRFNCENKQI